MNFNEWNIPHEIVDNYNRLGLQQMFPWQVECLKQPGVLDGKNLVYSAPTGAGKSLVAEILLLRRFLNTKKKTIFILPFISLAREKMFAMREVFEVLGLRVDGYMGGSSPSGGFSSVDVAVCTIEKANTLINRLIDENQMNQLGMVIVDEIHMIGDANRGYLIELLLTKIKYLNQQRSNFSSSQFQTNNISIVGMSASIPNLNLLACWLEAECYQTNFRPVPLTNYLKIGNDLFDKDLNKIRSYCAELKHDEDGITDLCVETLQNNHSVLIFCPTKNWCENLALSIANQFSKLKSQAPNIQPLKLIAEKISIDDVVEQLQRSPAGLDDILKKTIPFRVGYHHAGLTTEERDIVETGFRNNTIRVLVATSTLSSGVNLPARRVIIRTPSFNRGLLDVRSYHQMAGRAGRKGIDDQGESILVCKPHEKIKGQTLMTSRFPPVTSCLVVNPDSHNEISSAIRRAILEVIVNGIAGTYDEVKIYIRCTLLSAQMSFNDQSRNSPTGSSSDKRNGNDRLIIRCIEWLQEHEFVYIQRSNDGANSQGSFIIPTKLGKAALMSSLHTSEALRVLADLQIAAKACALDSELHLVYQVTPIYSLSKNLNWFNYLNIYENLPSAYRRVADLVGVDEGFITRLAASGGFRSNHKLSESRERQLNVHTRFYACLILHDLLQELPLAVVCEKYSENRGMVQSLQQSAATFAGMVTAFCQQLGWWSLEVLLREFQSRLVFGIQRDLLDLMQISLLNSARARALFSAGLTTIRKVATSKAKDIEVALRNVQRFRSKRNDKDNVDDDKDCLLRGIRVPGSSRSLTDKEATVWIIREAKTLCGLDGDSFCSKSSQTDILDNLVNIPEVEKTDVAVFSQGNHHQNNPEKTFENLKSDHTNHQVSAVLSVDLKVHQQASQPSNQYAFLNDNITEADMSNQHRNDISKSLNKNCCKTSKHIKISNEINHSITESQMVAVLEDDLVDHCQTLHDQCWVNPSVKPTSSTPILQPNRKNSSSFSFSLSPKNHKSSPLLEKPKTNFSTSKCSSLSHVFSSKNDCSDDLFEGSIASKKKESNISSVNAFSLSCGPDIDWSTESAFQYSTFDAGAKGKNTHVHNATRDNSASSIPFSNYICLNQEGNKSRQSVEEEMSRLSISNGLSYDDEHVQFRIMNLNENTSSQQEFFKKWKRKSKFSLCVARKIVAKEASNLDSMKNELILVVYWGDGRVYLCNLEPEEEGLVNQAVEILTSFSSNTSVVSFNAKSISKRIIKYLHCCTQHLQWRDPYIALWLIDPDETEEFDELLLFEKYSPKYYSLFKEFLHQFSNLSGMSHHRIITETVASYHVIDELEEKLKSLNLWESFIVTEMPHDLSMGLLESNGMAIDTSKLNNVLNELHERKQSLQKKAWLIVGRKFSLSSISEIRKVFLELGIANKSLGRFWSTSKEALNRLSRETNSHPLISTIVDWRSVHYAFACIQQINRFFLSSTSQVDSIIRRYHPNTHLTSVGKINMNMQFIPKTKHLKNEQTDSSDDYSFSLRDFFVATEGFVLLSIDYSQLELRLMAHLSADEILLKEFSCDEDVFRKLAARFYNKQDCLEKVTEEERRNAKEIIYAINYGVGSKSLSSRIDLSELEISKFRQQFANTYSRLHIFFQRSIDQCLHHGFITTLSGRRRYLPDIKSSNAELRAKAERQVRNSIIAGSAADVIKLATVRIISEMRRRGWQLSRQCSSRFFNVDSKFCYLIHQLHDELIFEVESKLVNEAAIIARDCMTNSSTLRLPLAVKIKVGSTWKNLEAYSIKT